MARLYADENFALPVVEQLRLFGHDVLTAFVAGQANKKIPDVAVLRFATTEGRALLSFNRLHFVRLHHARIEHSGIVVCTFDLEFVALAGRVHEAISACGELSGRLLRVTKPHPQVSL